MRILAKKPDYYDMVSHLFGRDPSITYHRKDFECKEILMHINAYENHCYARNMREGHQCLLSLGQKEHLIQMYFLILKKPACYIMWMG